MRIEENFVDGGKSRNRKMWNEVGICKLEVSREHVGRTG